MIKEKYTYRVEIMKVSEEDELAGRRRVLIYDKKNELITRGGRSLINFEKDNLKNVFIIPELKHHFDGNILVCQIDESGNTYIVYKIFIYMDKFIEDKKLAGEYVKPIRDDGYNELANFVWYVLNQNRKYKACVAQCIGEKDHPKDNK